MRGDTDTLTALGDRLPLSLHVSGGNQDQCVEHDAALHCDTTLPRPVNLVPFAFVTIPHPPAFVSFRLKLAMVFLEDEDSCITSL
jgi:hypothetical protein